MAEVRKRVSKQVRAGENAERVSGCYERQDRERERDNFVSALTGAMLNCGLPTLINFGRFISVETTRRWQHVTSLSAAPTLRTSFSALAPWDIEDES